MIYQQRQEGTPVLPGRRTRKDVGPQKGVNRKCTGNPPFPFQPAPHLNQINVDKLRLRILMGFYWIGK